jgi:hypothetical protein
MQASVQRANPFALHLFLSSARSGAQFRDGGQLQVTEYTIKGLNA